MISFKPLIFFIDELLCQLENIITQRQNERFRADFYMSFEYYNHRNIFKHPITICKNIYLDIIQSQNFISRELKLHKTHITYDFYAKRFMVSNFESGIILNPELLKKFNFMFINGLIKNQLSINNKAHSDNQYYDKSIHFLGCHFDEHFTIFQVNIKNDFIFEHVLFKKHVYIYSTKTNQNFTFLFKNCTINTINMQNNTFLSNIEFILNTKISNLELYGNNFNGILSVQDSVIENINLYENEFKNKCYFKYICFGDKESKESKINLSNANFQNDIYFDNSIFYSYADFHACEFNKIASFYGVTFDKTPNFSQAIFKGSLNAVNTNLNFTFDNLRDRIKQEYEDFNKDKNEKDKKSLDKFANDFRDSFRVFKNALIKDNNLLDASNFHKYELYCKEIELNSNDILSKYERDEVFDKLALCLKQKVDWCLLLFYRKLSDHHTDLLKVINNCFVLIAIYFMCIFNFTNVDFLEIKEINIFSFLKSFSFYGDDKIVAAAKVSPLYFLLLLFFAPIAIFMASLYYSDKQKRSVIFKKIKFKIGKFLLIVAIFAAICFALFVINSNFFIPLTKIAVFWGIFFLVIYIDSLYLRYYCVILSYINFIIIIAHYPIILNPLIGKVLNDKIKIEDPLVMVMTFTYTILMFLVLFSLQKTARKNSIVPS